ncbi:sigma-70 family RNA polymerase sigma factor [Caulobacter hibisci]|uniref:Sigma-70 family RNA polymerase sigma factor n=1 Tax=Caulobacter hibisci TaxID=2035993 RepID=A0ABS0SZU2_9CAUL|nr:sigma-70 family RNA polymerase sigma factor [Caulobacter hibisci]
MIKLARAIDATSRLRDCPRNDGRAGLEADWTAARDARGGHEAEETMSSPALSRNPEVLQKLDTRFRRPLMSFFLRRVFNRAEAEDLTQQVFVKLVGSSEVDRLENADRFVFTVAANLLRDRAKNVARRHEAQSVSIDPHLVAEISRQAQEEISPERVLLGREALADVFRSIDELGEKTKAIFVLHRLENMKHREIAELLGIGVSTVESMSSGPLCIWRANTDLCRDRSTRAIGPGAPDGRSGLAGRAGRGRSGIEHRLRGLVGRRRSQSSGLDPGPGAVGAHRVPRDSRRDDGRARGRASVRTTIAQAGTALAVQPRPDCSDHRRRRHHRRRGCWLDRWTTGHL